MTHPDITHMQRTGETPTETLERIARDERPCSYVVSVACCIDVPVEAEDEESAEREAIDIIKTAVREYRCEYQDGEAEEISPC